MSNTFRSLKHYNYRLWVTSILISSSGTWMQRVAQDWVVLTVLSDHSGFAVGVTTALQFLPQLLFSVYAGVIADYFDRRRIIQIGQAVVALSGLVTGILVLTGLAQLWQIFLLAFIAGTADTFCGPARQTFVTDMVPKADLTNAVALSSAAFHSARLFGPGLAGGLIAWVGPGWVFIANAGIFLVPIVVIVLMRVQELRPRPKAKAQKGMIKDGWRYISGRPDLVAIIVIATVVGALGMNFPLTQAVMATQVFSKGAGEYGLLGSITAIGSVGGALIAARRVQVSLKQVLIATVLFGLCEGACALAPSYWTFALLLIPMGLATITLITLMNATIQLSTADKYRGRVLSFYLLFFLGCTPIGSPTVGWIAEHIGPRWSLGVGAIGALLVAAGVRLYFLSTQGKLPEAIYKSKEQ